MDGFAPGWISRVTSFEPPKNLEAPADWDEAVRFLAHHGLAGIAAYNLAYRLPAVRTPEAAKDLLLGFHQGVANDNVFKLMSLKGALAGVEAPAILLDAASFTDTLYPHIGFRAVPELRLLVREADRAAIERALAEEGFLPAEPDEPDPDAPASVLFNTRFYLKLYTRLLPGGGEEGLFARASRAKVYGPGALRLSGEDALLVHVLSLARRGFAVPLVELVDLRELVRGEAGWKAGPGATLDPATVRARAREVGADRALYAGLALTGHFFPEVEGRLPPFVPDLGVAVRSLLDAAVVNPAKDPGRDRQLRGLDKLVRLLVG